MELSWVWMRLKQVLSTVKAVQSWRVRDSIRSVGANLRRDDVEARQRSFQREEVFSKVKCGESERSDLDLDTYVDGIKQ